MEATKLWSLGWEDPLEKEMATHSSILAWRIPWAEQHGGLQSSRERVGQELATKQQKHLKTQWRQKNSLCASHLQQHPQSSAKAENCYPDFTDEETRNFETWSEWAPESQQQMAKPIESQGFLTPNPALFPREPRSPIVQFVMAPQKYCSKIGPSVKMLPQRAAYSDKN